MYTNCIQYLLIYKQTAFS